MKRSVVEPPPVFLTFDKVRNPLHPPRKRTSERQKWPDLDTCFAPQWCTHFGHLHFQKCSDAGVISTFLFGNVLRATTVCTFSTSQLPKVVRTLVCFVPLDVETCFAPQRRALFRQLNFQKCSKGEEFLAFSLANALRATTACTFPSPRWPHGSAPAALASLLFDPPQPQIIGKNTVNREFPTFSRTCLFFLLTLSLLSSSHFFPSPL